MKINQLSILSLLFAIMLSSCMGNKGGWDDNIRLSARAVTFSASPDSVIITTGGNWWWVADITVDSVHFYMFEGVDLQADTYTIKQDCFVVERRNKNTLFIKIAENPLPVKRIIGVGLEAGDYFDRVVVTQKPK